MRIRSSLIAFAGAAVLAAGSSFPAPAAESDRAETGAVIFSVGGTPLSNGVFTPGTAVYDGSKVVGAPITIEKGQNFEFINLDEGTVANGHKIVSLKLTRRSKSRPPRPVFQSKLLTAPGQSDIVKTSELPRGTYEFNCPVHTSMYGILQIK